MFGPQNPTPPSPTQQAPTQAPSPAAPAPPAQGQPQGDGFANPAYGYQPSAPQQGAPQAPQTDPFMPQGGGDPFFPQNGGGIQGSDSVFEGVVGEPVVSGDGQQGAPPQMQESPQQPFQQAPVQPDPFAVPQGQDFVPQQPAPQQAPVQGAPAQGAPVPGAPQPQSPQQYQQYVQPNLVPAGAQTGAVQAPPQPPQTPALPEAPVAPEKPVMPERPTKPEGYDRFEAQSDPASASAQYDQAVHDFNERMADYQVSAAQYGEKLQAYQGAEQAYRQQLRQITMQEAQQKFGVTPEVAADFYAWVSNPVNTDDLAPWFGAYMASRQQAAQQAPPPPVFGQQPYGYPQQQAPQLPTQMVQPQVPYQGQQYVPQTPPVQAPQQQQVPTRPAFNFPPFAGAQVGQTGVGLAQEDVMMGQMIGAAAPGLDF